MISHILSLSVPVCLLAAACCGCRAARPTAAALGERYQQTRAEADRLAWVEALDAEGHDFSRRYWSPTDANGFYKFNRESKLVCMDLRRVKGDSWSWREETEDGPLALSWTRNAAGGIDYERSAPTNWSFYVFTTPGHVTRYAAKVMKRTYRAGDAMPRIEVPEGWRILDGEEFTGVNVREAFFTVEGAGTNLPPPKVSVTWPGVALGSVHGASEVTVAGETASFRPTARKCPNGFGTSLKKVGCVSFSVTHHLEGMQAGPYRGEPFPTNRIAAANNFAFAARAGLLRLGFDRESAMYGSLWIGTFDSHYPNGHEDYPPHFHIIPKTRDGQQVCHFYVDEEKGLITENCEQDMNAVMDTWDRVFLWRRGDEFPMYDGTGKVVFREKILEDGTGLEISLADRSRRIRIASPSPKDHVDVQEPDGTGWKTVLRVAVKDDPVRGVMTTPEGEIRYDPVTGRRL